MNSMLLIIIFLSFFSIGESHPNTTIGLDSILSYTHNITDPENRINIAADGESEFIISVWNNTLLRLLNTHHSMNYNSNKFVSHMNNRNKINQTTKYISCSRFPVGMNSGYYISSGYGFCSDGSCIFMQSDGNLVVYDQFNEPLWASNTYTSTPSTYYHLVMQTDGNLVIYDATGKATWASNTYCGLCPNGQNFFGFYGQPFVAAIVVANSITCVPYWSPYIESRYYLNDYNSGSYCTNIPSTTSYTITQQSSQSWRWDVSGSNGGWGTQILNWWRAYPQNNEAFVFSGGSQGYLIQSNLALGYCVESTNNNINNGLTTWGCDSTRVTQQTFRLFCQSCESSYNNGMDQCYIQHLSSGLCANIVNYPGQILLQPCFTSATYSIWATSWVPISVFNWIQFSIDLAANSLDPIVVIVIIALLL